MTCSESKDDGKPKRTRKIAVPRLDRFGRPCGETTHISLCAAPWEDENEGEIK